MSVYGAGRLGLGGRALSEGIAQAATAQSPSSPILVSVFLAGGADALSVLAPTEDPTYRKLRPTLAISPDQGIPFAEDPRLSWGPAAAAFAQLHSAGKLTVFPGIGYADPDMSHFTSRHYWEVGAADTRLVTGWLGRYLDQVGTAANPLQGLSMDGEMNPTLATAVNPVAAIDRPDDVLAVAPGRLGRRVLADARRGLGAGRRPPALRRPGDRPGGGGGVGGRGRAPGAGPVPHCGWQAGLHPARSPIPRRPSPTSRCGSPGWRP